MPLNYTLKYEKIEFNDGQDDISVRGLGVPEITQIVSVNTEAAVALFDEIVKTAGEQKEIDLGLLIFTILQRFEIAVAHTIALAADVPDQIDEVTKLPVDVQVKALEVIARRSFGMDGGAKKFWEIVAGLLAQNGDLKAKMLPFIETFTNGFGRSEGN